MDVEQNKDENVVANHLRNLQERMQKDQDVKKGEGQNQNKDVNEDDKIDFDSTEMRQAWAF